MCGCLYVCLFVFVCVGVCMFVVFVGVFCRLCIVNYNRRYKKIITSKVIEY